MFLSPVHSTTTGLPKLPTAAGVEVCRFFPLVSNKDAISPSHQRWWKGDSQAGGARRTCRYHAERWKCSWWWRLRDGHQLLFWETCTHRTEQCHEAPGPDRDTSLLSSLEEHFLTYWKQSQVMIGSSIHSLSARMQPKGQIAIYRWPDLENKWHLSRLILLWSIKACFLTQGTSCTYQYRHTRLPSTSGAALPFPLLRKCKSYCSHLHHSPTPKGL